MLHSFRVGVGVVPQPGGVPVDRRLRVELSQFRTGRVHVEVHGKIADLASHRFEVLPVLHVATTDQVQAPTGGHPRLDQSTERTDQLPLAFAVPRLRREEAPHVQDDGRLLAHRLRAHRRIQQGGIRRPQLSNPFGGERRVGCDPLIGLQERVIGGGHGKRLVHELQDLLSPRPHQRSHHRNPEHPPIALRSLRYVGFAADVQIERPVSAFRQPEAQEADRRAVADPGRHDAIATPTRCRRDGLRRSPRRERDRSAGSGRASHAPDAPGAAGPAARRHRRSSGG